MTLTKDQIQHLYKFTRKHYVEYYDLQTELVDHLANGIERQWEEDSKLSFNEALQKEFKKFGIFGFHDVIGEKTNAMGKRYRKIIFNISKDYFRLPKILLLLGSTITLFTLLSTIPVEIGKYILAGSVALFLITIFVKVHSNGKKLKKKEKKWLLEAMIMNFGHSLGFMNFVLQIFYYPRWVEIAVQSQLGTFLLSFFSVLLILFVHIVVNIIPKKAEELLIETYPEYKIAS